MKYRFYLNKNVLLWAFFMFKYFLTIIFQLDFGIIKQSKKIRFYFIPDTKRIKVVTWLLKSNGVVNKNLNNSF